MQHIFIITYGRSGSTALQNALNALPGFCIRGENGGAVVSLFQAAQAVRREQAGREETDRHHPWFGIEQVDADALQAQLAGIVGSQILRPPEGTTTTGFKEIRHGANFFAEDEDFQAYVDFLLGNFADARAIFLTRAAEQVAKSGWWQDVSPKRVTAMVELCDARFSEAHRRHPGNSFLIDHSQYDRNPDGLLPLMQWLGQDSVPGALEKSAQRLDHLQNFAAKSRKEKLVASLRERLGLT